MIDSVELFAHQQRLSQSLDKASSQGALFNLYLAMLAPNISPEHASSGVLNGELFSQQGPAQENLYTGISFASHSKENFYADQYDYQRNKHFCEHFQSANDPSVLLRWHQSFSPQAHHYATGPILIDDDVKQNSSFITQQTLNSQGFEFDSDSAFTDTVSDDIENIQVNNPHFNEDNADLFSVIEDAHRFSI